MTRPARHLADAFDPERFREQGRRVVDLLADYLARASAGGDLAVLPWSAPETMLARWPAQFPAPAPHGASLDALVARVLADSNHLHHPRYVGHQVTAPLPDAALCDLVAGLLNNGMAVYEMGPAATAIERSTLSWMAARLGFGSDAGGVFTSGGSLGNLTALLAARQVKAGFDVWGEGGHAGPPLAVLASEQTHYSVKRALQVMGLGEAAALPVPADARFRLEPRALPGALRAAERAGRRPIAVVASAGSTATGAFDPLDAVADFCEAHGLWLHVDGAHGAAAALCADSRPLLAGIERADSVVWDAHKMLLVPALATAVLFRDGGHSWSAFSQEASYLFHGDGSRAEWFDVSARTLECTKRMLAFKLYAVLSLYGEGFFSDYVAGTFALARRFAERLAAAADFELAVAPQCNIVCFRYRKPGVAGEALDALQARIRRRLVEGGDYYLVQTRLPGGIFLRTTLINPLTRDEDLAALLQAIRELEE